MTITYALLSVICGAFCAVFAWLGSGPVLAAVTYVGVGSAALLGLAFMFSHARPDGTGVLDRKGMKTARKSAAG